MEREGKREIERCPVNSEEGWSGEKQSVVMPGQFVGSVS